MSQALLALGDLGDDAPATAPSASGAVRVLVVVSLAGIAALLLLRSDRRAATRDRRGRRLEGLGLPRGRGPDRGDRDRGGRRPQGRGRGELQHVFYSAGWNDGLAYDVEDDADWEALCAGRVSAGDEAKRISREVDLSEADAVSRYLHEEITRERDRRC